MYVFKSGMILFGLGMVDTFEDRCQFTLIL